MKKLISYIFNETAKMCAWEVVHEALSSNGEKPFIAMIDGYYRIQSDWRNLKTGETYIPFDLLSILHGGETKAVKYLIDNGWLERPIDQLIFDTNGKLDASRTAEYLKAYGFLRVSQPNRDEIRVYLNDGGILKEFNYKTDTVSFLTSRIESVELKNKLHSVRGQAVAVWQLFEGVPYNLQLDDKNNIYIPFSGKVAQVQADTITLIDYEELDLFVPVASMKHKFSYTDDKGMYERFLECGSTGTDKPDDWTDDDLFNIKAFDTSIGYLISTYRDPSFNKAIIYSDFGANGEERNGRRGKSLILGALALMRKAMLKPDDSFDPSYKFKFSDLEEFFKIYQLDDVPKNFNYYSLFTSITGGIACERKGKPATEIEYRKTPKWAITTNFVVPMQSDEQSVIARYAEYQFKPFWSATFTPKEYFGERFFDDWDTDEWNRFYSFMCRCAQAFLKYGLLEISIDKKESRYLAYIGNNEGKVSEMERIFKELSGYPSFSVTDFLTIHYRNSSMRYDRLPLWTTHTVKRDVNLWVEHHNLNYTYSQRVREWQVIGGNDDVDDMDSSMIANDLPF